ncbi:MAG: hypothetical protein IPN76_19490 [Saprospiraceae bacterium]|nr:hypothetical protein [Saprospiraceae bacterium]
MQSTTVCFQPCLDTCEVVPNAFYQMASATCQGDSLQVSLTACNLGNFDLPAGTPISFYLGNPTATNATLLGTYALPQALIKDACGTFQYIISAPPNTTIYVMLNDDGTARQGRSRWPISWPMRWNATTPTTSAASCTTSQPPCSTLARIFQHVKMA